MDPGQIDQVLANLVVNARDAISVVGKLTIETGNAELDEEHCSGHAGLAPGRYVMLAVTDDGSGMDEETMAHIFEPFFTTKPQGQGTGLGLATVYGIVKQNRGFIGVESEPRKGTTFRIHLPSLAEESQPKGEPNANVEPETGTETILLVEDEGPLLDLIRRITGQLGYTVLAAPSPGEALRLAQEHPGDIHLVVTDVVMPEMSGRELWQRIHALRPRTKCLFMSGYTADAIVRHGVLDEGIRFIQKPFSRQELAAGLREALAP
jgi:CheY-like chemotaxis protein